MSALLSKLKKGKVLVVGDVMLDKYLEGKAERLSPESPVPVLTPLGEESRLGGAANVALNVSSLGSKVKLLGVVGKDLSGEEIKDLLKENKISNSLVKSNLSSITKQRILAGNQQLLRIDREDQFTNKDWIKTKENFKKEIAKYSSLVISDYGKGTLFNVQELISLSNKKKVPVIVDPKGDDFSKYKGAFIITPNLQEFSKAVGGFNSEAELEKKSKLLIKKLSLSALLITRGPEGMTLFSKNNNQNIVKSHYPAQTIDVFDVSGAGDTVIATIASGVASKIDLNQSVELSNITAGVVVSKLGTSSFSLDEIIPFLTGSSTLDANVSVKAIQRAKKERKKIVFTNGCFDILHAGHVSYLKEARSKGDLLIVGINDDKSVSRLKGKGRPVNNLENRIEVLSSLQCVDMVIPFSEDTPLDLIKEVVPDVLVKGEDYKINQIVGSDFVKKTGGKVERIKFVKGLSTSNLIKKLKKN